MKTWFNRIWKVYVFDPLAGGNGKIQTHEYAQWTLIVMIACASYREGATAEQVYPDIYWISLFAAMCAVAAIKPVFAKNPEKKDEAV
jgi:hypothetical protein